MPPVVVIQEIRAPVERVFRFVGDVETHPRFAHFSREVKITSPIRDAVGTRFHQVYQDGHECDSEIVVWEPFRRIVWHNYEGTAAGPAQIITYAFEQEGDVTHVVHMVQNPVFEDQRLHRKGMHENVREMANLKAVLEGGRPDLRP